MGVRKHTPEVSMNHEERQTLIRQPMTFHTASRHSHGGASIEDPFWRELKWCKFTREEAGGVDVGFREGEE